MKIIKGIILLIIIFAFSIIRHKKSKGEENSGEILSDFKKIYHIDSGRKFFTVFNIQQIIDGLAKNDYTALELTIGNGGLRFLLDDMTISIDGKTYSSDEVKAATNRGNKIYCDNGKNEWTEEEMNEILGYAKNQSISVIPLLNSPGHLNTILYVCSNLSGIDCSYQHSNETIDLTNEFAVKFTFYYISKYIEYFSRKECKIFNLGADEYALDVYMKTGKGGFLQLIKDGQYKQFIDYVNAVAKMIKKANMIPMAFNDGFYYGGETQYGIFDKDILISYWSKGMGNSVFCPVQYFEDNGYKVINTNFDWYYVLDWDEFAGEAFQFKNRKKLLKTIPFDMANGGDTLKKESLAGVMVCYWCDMPNKEYDDVEQKYVQNQIELFAKSNTKIFKRK